MRANHIVLPLLSMLLVCTAGGIDAAVAEMPVDKQEAIDLYNSAITGRKLIKQAVLKISSTRSISKENRVEEDVSKVFDVYLSGNKTRVDQSWEMHGNATSFQQVVTTPDLYIANHSPQVPVDYTQSVELMRRLQYSSESLNVRVLGLVPLPLTALNGLSFGQLSLSPSSVGGVIKASDSFDGQECVRYEYELIGSKVQPGKAKMIAWVLNKSNVICGLSIRGTRPDGVVQEDIVRFRSQTVGNIEFPASVEYSCTVGGEVTCRELLEVTSCSFNSGVDASLFTISGLGLPEGRKVLVDGGSLMYVNDGALVDGLNRIDTTETTSLESYKSIFIVANCVAIVVITALLVVRSAKLRKG